MNIEYRRICALIVELFCKHAVFLCVIRPKYRCHSNGGDTHAETTSVNRRWKNDTESWKQTGRGAEDIRKGNERRACESKPDGETTF